MTPIVVVLIAVLVSFVSPLTFWFAWRASRRGHAASKAEDRRTLEGGGTLVPDYIQKTDRAMASQSWIRCFRSGYNPESWTAVRAWNSSNLAKRMIDAKRKLAEEKARVSQGVGSVVMRNRLQEDLDRMKADQDTLAIELPSRKV
ncbi:hypothetical protein F503_03202 [Ophiostoma piceae UAMH 11346]|uniref:Uncharacterized protein n=1 Tax=Ophiostoma piceae (strain UAMH 11346) TaxID=1262450 RepID=S3D0L9_OPHP1|nr:hypothetical protein F503_03202 [Ophiostoma piceae UAMH 11346]